MGAHPQDPTVPALGVEIPADLLKDEAAPVSPFLQQMKKLEDRKIVRDNGAEPGLGGAFAATVVVVALLLGAFVLLRKFMGRSRLFAPGNSMRVLARRPIAPRQEVVLVEIGPRVLVVGATRESLSRLGEITSAEEIASLRARCGVASDSSSIRIPRVVEPAAAPAEEARPAASYDGVLEELSKIRNTVRDWTRQEATL